MARPPHVFAVFCSHVLRISPPSLSEAELQALRVEVEEQQALIKDERPIDWQMLYTPEN